MCCSGLIAPAGARQAGSAVNGQAPQMAAPTAGRRRSPRAPGLGYVRALRPLKSSACQLFLASIRGASSQPLPGNYLTEANSRRLGHVCLSLSLSLSLYALTRRTQDPRDDACGSSGARACFGAGKAEGYPVVRNAVAACRDRPTYVDQVVSPRQCVRPIGVHGPVSDRPHGFRRVFFFHATLRSSRAPCCTKGVVALLSIPI